MGKRQVTVSKKKMLDEYLAMLEEAKKRDHRKIGKEMDLFMFTDMVGKGLPMWLPKGTALRIRLQDFLRRIQARYDYQEVMCPPIGNKNLYNRNRKTKGRWKMINSAAIRNLFAAPFHV